MKKVLIALVPAILLSFCVPANAATDEERAARRAEFEAMTPDERRAARDARRAEIQAQSPEERQASREARRGQRQERIAGMTDEQKAAMRDRRQAAKGRGDGQRGQSPRGPRRPHN